MGKTRIAKIESEKETKKAKRAKKQSLKDRRGVRVPGLKGGERVVAVGGELPPEKKEPEEKVEKEKEVKEARAPRKRGRRYLAARAQVEPGKLYSPSEAVKLARQASISRFDGKLEMHLVLSKKGEFKLGKEKIQTEKKAPILHTVVGKITDKEEELVGRIAKIVKAVGERNIKKAVVSPSMGPGIKIDFQKARA